MSRAAIVLLLVALFPCAVEAEPAPAVARSGLTRWIARVVERVKLPPKLKAALDSRTRLVRGHSTRLTDRVEKSLPPGLVPAFHKVRLANPMTVTAFAVRKFREDPIFLTAYGVISTVVNNLKAPLLMALGMAPFPAVLLQELTNTPITLGVLIWRQHHLREDRSQTLRQTVRRLAREYRDFAGARREENRRFMAERDARRRPARGDERLLPGLEAALEATPAR